MEGITDTKSLPSSPHTSFPPENTTSLTLRDASFSAYLAPDAPKKDAPFPAMEDDSEIGIFDARKYFNESGENQLRESAKVELPPVAAVQHVESMTATRASSVSSMEPPPLQASSPGVWSEASCSNNIASQKTNVRKWFSGMIRRIICPYPCFCWGKKKNQVEHMEKVSDLPRSSSHRNFGSDPNSLRKSLTANLMHKVSKKYSKSLDRGRGRGLGDWTLSDRCSPPIFPPEIHFPSIPVFLGQASSSPPKLVFTSEGNPILVKEPPRHSLEIFRPSDFCISRKSGSDSIPPPRILAPDLGAHDRQRSFKFSVSPTSGGASIDDEDEDEDGASDTSSDLFEIESLTTGTPTNYTMCHRRRESMEEAVRRFVYGESGTPSECYTYEPSEASVEWSVTTAEGFDRGSVTNFSASASDIVDDVTLMRLELQRLGNGGSDGGGGRRRENGILVTCRCGLRR